MKKEITALYYAYQHPDLKPLPKLIILFTLGYALSPIYLIPDSIPVMIRLSIRLIPEIIMIQSREKALQHPIKLKGNWFFAFVFITIWAILLAVIIVSVLKLFTR